MGNTPAKVEPKQAVPKQTIPPTQKQATTGVPQKAAVPVQVDKTPAQNPNIPNTNKPAVPPIEEKDNFKFHTTDSSSETTEEHEFKFFSEPLEVSTNALSSIISIDEDNIFFNPPPIQQVSKQQLDSILHTKEKESVDRSIFEVNIKPIRVLAKPVHNVFEDFEEKKDDDFFGDRKIIMGKKPATLFEEDIFIKEDTTKVKTEDLWGRTPKDKSIIEDKIIVGSDRSVKEKERQEAIKQEAVKMETETKQELAKKEALRQQALKEETAKRDVEKRALEETAKRELEKQQKEEAIKQEQLKKLLQEQAKLETITVNKTEEDLFAIDSFSAKPKSKISFLDEDDLFKDTQLPTAAPITTSSKPVQLKNSDNLWGDDIIAKYEAGSIEIQKKLAQEQEINKLKREEDQKRKEELAKKK